MKFNLVNTSVSNENNTILDGYISGFAENHLKPFWLSGKEAHSDHTGVAVIRLNKVGNHTISWSIQDMETGDTIAGNAVLNKEKVTMHY